MTWKISGQTTGTLALIHLRQFAWNWGSKMREIKFRAWIEPQNEMIFSDLEPLLNGYKSNDSRVDIQESEDYFIMQYTGLKDKNGKEIYEGDIVSLESWKPKNHQIKFIEGAFCLANKEGEYSADIFYIHHAGRSQGEIIGNIYENPELLK